MRSGCNVSNSIENRPVLAPVPYLRRLAERREVEEIRQLTNFGLTIGWLLTLLGGFCWFCVISSWDVVWSSLMLTGIVLLVLGTVLPQALKWPHRLWMGMAHVQGRVVMTFLLITVYFTLFVPLGWWERRKKRGKGPFYQWNRTPPDVTTGWERIDVSSIESPATFSGRRGSRSLMRLFAETLGFFARRGHYMLLPVLILLLVLGLVLFFVQTSVLAPFIYTIGTVAP